MMPSSGKMGGGYGDGYGFGPGYSTSSKFGGMPSLGPEQLGALRYGGMMHGGFSPFNSPFGQYGQGQYGAMLRNQALQPQAGGSMPQGAAPGSVGMPSGNGVSARGPFMVA